MAKFLDGPAAGVSLLLHRAPFLLRAVCKPGGAFDALDQLDDEPEPDETIAVYRFVDGTLSRFHLCRSPRKLSGWYTSADYSVLDPQPTDAEVRSAKAWHDWCFANAERLGFKGKLEVEQ